MADQSDVETAIANVVAGVLYPAGVTKESAIGRVCRVYRGWPNAAALDADLAGGRINVTIFPDAAKAANTTRYPMEFVVTRPVTPTLGIATEGTTATVFGDAAAGQLVGLLVDGIAAVHRTQIAETPELVAAILASDLRARWIVQLSGASLNIPGAHTLIGRVVADQPARRRRVVKSRASGYRLGARTLRSVTRSPPSSTSRSRR